MASPRRVIWSPEAYRQLMAAFDFIARDSIDAAERVTGRIVERTERLDVFPERGTPVARLEGPVRALLVDRYRVLYEVREDEVHVLGVVHTSRDFEAWVDALDHGERGD